MLIASKLARLPAQRPALARTRVRGRTQRRATAKRSQAKASSADDGDGSGYDGGHDGDSDSSDDGEDPDDADSSAAGEGSPALLTPEAAQETELRCTPEHPFFVRGQGWVGADKLRVGDELVGDQGETLVVVAKEIRQQQARHFNFEVEDWHTYFVAEAELDPGVWVHNTCRDPILADNDLLVNAFDHGDRAALAEIQAGKTFITSDILSEFMNSNVWRERWRFLRENNITVHRASYPSNLRRLEVSTGSRARRFVAFREAILAASSCPSRNDATLPALADFLGITAVTAEKSLFNAVAHNLTNKRVTRELFGREALLRSIRRVPKGAKVD